MIIDAVENVEIYRGLSKNLDTALSYIASTDFSVMSEGTIEIEGRNVYVMVQPSETAGTEGREYEAHRKYIDLQFLVSGRETMICSKLNGLSETVAYDAEKDVAMYELSDGGTSVRMQAGDFIVLFPHDAHVPKIMTDGPEAVLKAVVKVRV